jgi:hypothetical protein
MEWRHRSLGACIALVALLAVFAPLARGADPTPGMPQAFCQTPPAQRKGGPPTGFFRTRPHGCRFHRLGLEEDGLSDLVFRIHWRFWTGRRASGIGRFTVHVIDYKTGKHSRSSGPEVVRLSRPRRICGHNVFTRLETKVYLEGRVLNDFVSELDEVGADEEGCPQGR